MNSGKVVQGIRPGVDIEVSPRQLPPLYNAGEISLSGSAPTAGPPSTPSSPATAKLTVEVASHLGDNRIRAIALGPTEGLRRGMEALDTGAPVTVPVGRGCLGRLMDVLGEPKDDRGPI